MNSHSTRFGAETAAELDETRYRELINDALRRIPGSESCVD